MAARSRSKQVSRDEAQRQLERHPLTTKQELFCEHLARTHDTEHAAKHAGYTHGSARNLAGDPRIQERVRQLNAESAERLGVSADELIQEIAALAFSDVTQVIRVPYDQLENLPRYVRAAISEVRVRHNYDRDGFIQSTDCTIKMHSKNEAQRLLTNIIDPKPSTPGGAGEDDWTGLTVYTAPISKINGEQHNGDE